MDDRTYGSDPQDPEVAERLEAFADVLLTPSVAATTRMRAAVMTAAHRRAALLEADRTFEAQGSTWAARERQQAATPGPQRTFWQTWRRPLSAVLAGCLTFAILFGTAWAARPGGPLYSARLWTEMANLPADLVARADAEVRRLEARIDEAQRASSAGDGPGTEAALVAYTTIATEAATNSTGSPEASATIGTSVEAHVVVLVEMADSAPSPPARAAAENALVVSDRILEKLDSSPSQ
jgi:hypothetical protein